MSQASRSPTLPPRPQVGLALVFCAALEASHGLALKGVFLGNMWGLAEGGEAGGWWAWGRAGTHCCATCSPLKPSRMS